MGTVDLVAILHDLDELSEFFARVPFLCCLAICKTMKEVMTMQRQQGVGKSDNASMYHTML